MGKLLLMAAVLLVATFSANAKTDKVELCDGKIVVTIKILLQMQILQASLRTTPSRWLPMLSNSVLH